MNIKSAVVSNLSKLLLGRKLWSDARHLVSTIETNNKMTGSEKRASVFYDLQILAGDVSAVLINCAIELALLWLRGVAV